MYFIVSVCIFVKLVYTATIFNIAGLCMYAQVMF